MKWAIYRIHYGVDYIDESINSIIDGVDKVFIFYSLKPWILKKTLLYKDKKIPFPENPEKIFDYLQSKYKNNKKIIIKNYECDTPLNQFGKLYDLACIIEQTKPSYTLFMEPDMIFGSNQLRSLTLELYIKFWIPFIVTKQIELWKYNKTSKIKNCFRIPLRKKRVGPVLWKNNRNINGIITGFGGGSFDNKNNFSFLLKTLNMGFSFNEKTMYYKHLVSIVFSSVIGDSEPDEYWYDNKWIGWYSEMQDLEITKGSQHFIKNAYKYIIPNKYYKFF
tara:strand:- start:131 stop:961 length:831 start_codon:yes stop_codon:yes gene_type:complete